MENVNIETTQNVNIEYPIAGIPERMAAALLDLLIMAGYMLIASIIIKNIAGDNYRESRWEVSYILWAVFSIPLLFYTLAFETFMNGQTIGKRAVRIKVMRLDGRQPTFGNYIMRWIMRIIDIFLTSPLFGVIAIITVAVNGKGQRLGDIAAGTMVVKTTYGEEIGKTIFTNIQEEYVPEYPQATMLTLNEVNVIKRVLSLKPDENSEEAVVKLVTKLSEHLGINPPIDNRGFLKALVKDYNKVNGRN